MINYQEIEDIHYRISHSIICIMNNIHYEDLDLLDFRNFLKKIKFFEKIQHESHSLYSTI